LNSRGEYELRMHRVLHHIDAHLDVRQSLHPTLTMESRPTTGAFSCDLCIPVAPL
jgi:hypothetical protein